MRENIFLVFFAGLFFRPDRPSRTGAYLSNLIRRGRITRSKVHTADAYLMKESIDPVITRNSSRYKFVNYSVYGGKKMMALSECFENMTKRSSDIRNLLANSTVANVRSIIRSYAVHSGLITSPRFCSSFYINEISRRRDTDQNGAWVVLLALSIFLINISVFLLWEFVTVTFRESVIKYISAKRAHRKSTFSFRESKNVCPKQRDYRTDQALKRIHTSATFNFLRRAFYSGKSLRVMCFHRLFPSTREESARGVYDDKLESG